MSAVERCFECNRTLGEVAASGELCPGCFFSFDPDEMSAALNAKGDDYQEYQEYRARWQERYGDAVAANATIYIYGQKSSMPIRRMTADEHAAAVVKLASLNERTQAVIEAEQWNGMEMLLESAFAFEVALLI